MKKSFKIAGVVLGIGTIFGLGTLTGATTDWQTNAINNSYSELHNTASNETTDLTKNTNEDVNNTVNTAIQGTVADQQKQLEDLLQQYYQMKLQSLTDTQQFHDLEDQIKTNTE
jgi:small-conductance mechanosensitive channel